MIIHFEDINSFRTIVINRNCIGTSDSVSYLLTCDIKQTNILCIQIRCADTHELNIALERIREHTCYGAFCFSAVYIHNFRIFEFSIDINLLQSVEISTSRRKFIGELVANSSSRISSCPLYSNFFESFSIHTSFDFIIVTVQLRGSCPI